MIEFQKFSKIPRLSRDCTISEKLDGTNSSVVIFTKEELYKKIKHPDFTKPVELLGKREYEEQDFIDKYCLYKKDDLYMFAGSRKHWLDVSSKGDNFGFAKWVQANAEELLKLGEGRHFGEWYGNGIQRKYGLDEKRFALFNVKKWSDDEARPKCCEVVPILYEGMFDTDMITVILDVLKRDGSKAVPGYMNPEGIVIYHKASGQMFKKTIIGDLKPKGV
jgi:hypothetical protein